MKPRIRHEILSFSLVVSLPVAMAVVFPYEAIGFKPRASSVSRTAHAAFVTLDEDEEAAAMKAARASWRVSASDVRAAEIQIEELPERPISAVLGFGDRSSAPAVKPVVFKMPPYTPSAAAAPMPKTAPGRDPVKNPAFSRKELLSLDASP